MLKLLQVINRVCARTHTHAHTQLSCPVSCAAGHTHKKLLQNFSSQSHLHRDEPHFPPRLWSPAWLSTASGPWDPSLEHEDVINKKRGEKTSSRSLKEKRKQDNYLYFATPCLHTVRILSVKLQETKGTPSSRRRRRRVKTNRVRHKA